MEKVVNMSVKHEGSLLVVFLSKRPRYSEIEHLDAYAVNFDYAWAEKVCMQMLGLIEPTKQCNNDEQPNAIDGGRDTEFLDTGVFATPVGVGKKKSRAQEMNLLRCNHVVLGMPTS